MDRGLLCYSVWGNDPVNVGVFTHPLMRIPDQFIKSVTFLSVDDQGIRKAKATAFFSGVTVSNLNFYYAVTAFHNINNFPSNLREVSLLTFARCHASTLPRMAERVNKNLGPD